MRLKYIDTCSFSKSEATNFRELSKKNKWRTLGPDECVLLVSMTGDQVVFVYQTRDVHWFESRASEVVHSRRLRLDGRQKWNGTMLVNYAEMVGIKIDGLKRFEEHYR